MLIQSPDPVVKLVQGEVGVLGIHGLELAPITGNVRLGKESQAHAELVELLIYFSNCLLVILAEIGDGTEVGSQLAEQPHHLYVTLALTGKLAGGTHLVEVTVNVEFEKIARVISRSASLSGSATDETQLIHFEAVNEGIEQAYRGISFHILVNAIREKNP